MMLTFQTLHFRLVYGRSPIVSVWILHVSRSANAVGVVDHVLELLQYTVKLTSAQLPEHSNQHTQHRSPAVDCLCGTGGGLMASQTDRSSGSFESFGGFPSFTPHFVEKSNSAGAH